MSTKSSYWTGAKLIDELLCGGVSHYCQGSVCKSQSDYYRSFFAAMCVCLHRHALFHARLSKAVSTLPRFSPSVTSDDELIFPTCERIFSVAYGPYVPMLLTSELFSVFHRLGVRH